MAELPSIKIAPLTIEELEKRLHLKQLQINRLLQLTQSINNNIAARDLYADFTNFLTWEMNVRKLALYFRNGDCWEPVASHEVEAHNLDCNVEEILPRFRRVSRLEDETHPLLKVFQVVIPVYHKDIAIAYAFIGGMEVNDEFYNNIQVITTVTNVVAVAIENKRLFKKQLAQQALRKEMELARDMQRLMIPEKLPNGEKGYEMASIYQPKLSVGGDYYDYFEQDDGQFAFCVGDVTGKGVAAALQVANFQAVFHGLFEQHLTMEQFIRAFNRAVFRITKGDSFFTFFVAQYDPMTQMLRYVNAGHNPPVLIMNGKTQSLREGCTILGTVPKIPSLDIGEIHVSDEALIFCYTGGLTDVKSGANEFLDEDFIIEFTRDHYRLSADNFNTLLLKEIEIFTGGGDYPDDLTILTTKIY